METAIRPCLLFVSVIAIVLTYNGPSVAEAGGLKLGFYSKSCPSAESTVLKVVKKYVTIDSMLAPALLRMHFHDCFVRGCDGSVLLNSTKNKKSEKEATPNQTVRGFYVIDKAKSEVEKQCPGVVSCADILALSARDSILVAFGGPFWRVPTGRRDGVISRRAEALSNIPAPTSNYTQIKAAFAKKGLNVKDLVVLSGAHTVGVSHCVSFNTRLYNFTGKGDTDPSLDESYASELKKNKCRSISDNTTIVNMDGQSSATFDTHYYSTVKSRRGLFSSDSALLSDPIARAYVDSELRVSKHQFFKDFQTSMEKLNAIAVRVGNSGEIRRHCAFVNT